MTILPLNTLVCPHDQAGLHFEVMGSMRIKRSGSDLGIRSPGHFYKARCPSCGVEYLVTALTEREDEPPVRKSEPHTVTSGVTRPGDLLDQMIHLATNLFHGKKDKAGKPYILHCLKVMHYTKSDDEELLCIAIGHDILEDCFDDIHVGIKRLHALGFTQRIIDGIVALTKRPGLLYEDYKAQVKRNADARKVKMADLRHNSDIRRLKGVTKKDVERVVRYHEFYLELKELEC